MAGSPEQARMMQFIIGGALAMGVVVFAVVVAVLNMNPSQSPTPPAATPGTPPPPGYMGINPGSELLFMLAGGMVLTLVPASLVLRKAVSGGSSASDTEGIERRSTGFLLGAAMCEGPALFGAVVMLLSKQVAPPVYVVVTGVVGIVAHMAMPVYRAERDPNTTRYNVGS